MDYDTINLLGLQPHDIQDLNITREDNNVFINVTLARKQKPCPCCESLNSNIKDYRVKKITHSIFNTSTAFINYRCRRFVCNDCHKSFSEDSPFTASRQRISTATVMQVLKDCKRLNYTFTSIAEKNHISTSSAVNIFDQYVSMTPGSLPRVLSIDEFYLGRTWNSRFACIFIDWETGQIVDIFPSRKKFKLYSYMQYIKKSEFDNVRYVSIDMNTTYRDFAYHHFKHCTVMIDSFHVVKNINEALRNLRIHVMYSQDRDSVDYYLLKHWNHLLMKRKGDIEDNIPQYNRNIGYAINRPQILELLLKIDPVLKSAYQWKEDYLDFNEDCTYENASQRYDELYNQLVRLNMNEFREVTILLKNWRTEILNSFIRIDQRRISNGPVESVNGRIKILLKTSLKYRNFERLRSRIMYCINKDSLPLMTDRKKTNKEPGKKRGKYRKQ